MFKKFTAMLAGLVMAVTGFTIIPVQNANAAIGDVCGVAAGTPAVTLLSSATFSIDAAMSYDAQYIGYKINSPTNVKNLWVQLDTFAGGSVTLAPNQPAQ